MWTTGIISPLRTCQDDAVDLVFDNFPSHCRQFLGHSTLPYPARSHLSGCLYAGEMLYDTAQLALSTGIWLESMLTRHSLVFLVGNSPRAPARALRLCRSSVAIPTPRPVWSLFFSFRRIPPTTKHKNPPKQPEDHNLLHLSCTMEDRVLLFLSSGSKFKRHIIPGTKIQHSSTDCSAI